MNLRKLSFLLPVALLGLGACVTNDSTATPGTTLGIEQFVTEDTGNVTSIIGLDASGVEVGRVDIFHGTYTASAEFADGFSSATIDGRTFDAKVGTRSYHWETEGYRPTLSLPAPPGDQVAMGTFLEQPRVVDVMKHWGIGFERFVATPTADAPSLDGEDPYVLYCGDQVQAGIRSYSVSSYTGTGGLKYTSVPGVTLPNGEYANACSKEGNASQLGILTVVAASTQSGNISQYMIDQECTPTTGTYAGKTTLYRKSCPAGTGNDSQCGWTTGQCVGCPMLSPDWVGEVLDPGYPGGHSETVQSFVINASSGTTMNANEKIAYTCVN